MKSNPLDEQIMLELVGQVACVARNGKPETAVTTIITRPMWAAFCRATGMPPNCEPTEWFGVKKTRRVYGSRTIVVEAEEMAAVSFATG